jgi:hypothetical protein
MTNSNEIKKDSIKLSHLINDETEDDEEEEESSDVNKIKYLKINKTNEMIKLNNQSVEEFEETELNTTIPTRNLTNSKLQNTSLFDGYSFIIYPPTSNNISNIELKTSSFRSSQSRLAAVGLLNNKQGNANPLSNHVQCKQQNTTEIFKSPILIEETTNDNNNNKINCNFYFFNNNTFMIN